MRTLQQATARTVMVLMTDAADHITGKAGLTLTVTASKAGGAFASITPTVTERGSGWYALALTSAHSDTAGDLALHITATGADPADLLLQVSAPVLTTALGNGAITEASIATPAEAAGRPAGLLGMVRRLFEWGTNRKTRDRSNGHKKLFGADGVTVLETQTQSTVGVVDEETTGS
jgi:hypothetical protein